MAYDFSISAPYSGRPAFNLYLYVRRNQTDQANNRSSYVWELYARNPSGSGSTYALDCFPWSVSLGGSNWSGCHNLDFRGGPSAILLGSSGTGWFGHNPDGYLDIFVDCWHGPASIFGTADPAGAWFQTDRIPKAPGAPNSISVDQATTTSLRYTYSMTTDGGAPVLEWQGQADEDPAFGSPISISANGVSTFTGLTPGTRYYFRSRGRNAVGWGAWSPAVGDGVDQGVTLPAVPPGMTVTPSFSGTSTTVTLSPPSGVSSVTSYRVERRPIGGAATVYDTPTSPLVVSPLTPGDVFEWRASAFIGSYQTPWTDWVTVQQPNPNTNPGDYFDGSTPDKTDIDYQWNGAINNSTSRAVAKAPAGWRTFADGSDTSGGDGVVIRATGGRSGSFGARVTFFTDTVAAGFRAGTALETPGVQEVAEGGVYWGSIYVAPSRSQRMAAEIIWLDAAFAPIGASAVGVAEVVPANPTQMVRLTVQGTAPLGAVYGATGWVDVAGTGWSVWLGGQSVMMDDAMLSIGTLYDWFSGSTPDTAAWVYSWLGAENASVSMAVAQSSDAIDPLADPDCPPIPVPPQPPAIADDCIEEVGSWRRYWAIIPQEEVSDWLDLVATMTLTTGALPARQVRIRVYRNPDGLDPSVFPADAWEAEQIVSFIPASTVLTLDGVAQRVWAEVAGGDAISADRLLYGTGGGPASWPVLSCGTAYLISFDVPLDAPEGNLSVDVALTTRML